MAKKWQNGARTYREGNEAYADNLCIAGAQAAQTEIPAATVGIFSSALDAWQAGKSYKKNDLFTYNGKVGFARNNVTAQAHQPPFSTGLESVYGVRPIPDKEGRYPYVHNMAATVGMVVTDGGKDYVCIQAIDPVLYPPAQIPAHFAIK